MAQGGSNNNMSKIQEPTIPFYGKEMGLLPAAWDGSQKGSVVVAWGFFHGIAVKLILNRDHVHIRWVRWKISTSFVRDVFNGSLKRRSGPSRSFLPLFLYIPFEYWYLHINMHIALFISK